VTRLSRHQRAALGVLDREWLAADVLLERTSVYDTASGLAHVLGPLAKDGLCERRRGEGARGRVEWRLTAAGGAAMAEGGER
jgi:hypothetical protein